MTDRLVEDREQEAEIARLKAQVRSLLEPSGSPGRYATREEQPDDSEINEAIANADDWFDALWEIATKYDVPVTNNNPRWQEGRFLRPIAEFIGDIDDAAKKWLVAHRPTEPDEDVREALADAIESVGVYIPGSHGHDFINPNHAADAILARFHVTPRGEERTDEPPTLALRLRGSTHSGSGGVTHAHRRVSVLHRRHPERRTVVSAKIYGPPGFPGSGYAIEECVGGWRWRWIEPGEPDEHGEVFPSRSDALRDAANNWDDCGGIRCNLSATLRSLATREGS